jgi:N6-adenosine-specific RNA methylase IME4
MVWCVAPGRVSPCVPKGGVLVALTYRTIVADPPWPYPQGFNGWGKRRELPYEAMPLEEIAALPVPDLAAPGAHLYVWTTNRYLPETLSIVEMWGFVYTCTLVWAKPPGQKGQGGRFAITTEFIVHAAAPSESKPPRRVQRAGAVIKAARESTGLTRAELFHRVRGGKWTGLVNNWEMDICLPSDEDWQKLQQILPALVDTPRPQVPKAEPRESAPYFRHPSTWWQWPVGKHSEKPEAFQDLVEQVSPGPYLELFARRRRLGWDVWGNEVASDIDLPEAA